MCMCYCPYLCYMLLYFMYSLFSCVKTCMYFRIRRAGKVTRSGPELRRKPSRGTNINPFTPTEVQGRSRSSGVGVITNGPGENWFSTPFGVKTEIKSQKVCKSMK